MDKKISELTVVQSIDPADISLLVHNNTDHQFSFATLLSYVSNNLVTGASINFGTILPQNNTGNNGDVFINTASGTFAQKLSGNWTIVYTTAPGTVADGTLLYGLGAPTSPTGKNGDSYIDTGAGMFYKKTSGAWASVFTMLNGPAGAKGNKGDTGATGSGGKSILNGTAAPSNLYTGTDGDFYINTNTWNIFGPKTAGSWGIGMPMVQSPDNIKTIIAGLTEPLTINWQTADSAFYLLKHGDHPTYQEINKGDDGKWTVNGTPNINETRNDAGQLLALVLTPSVPGQTNFMII